MKPSLQDFLYWFWNIILSLLTGLHLPLCLLKPLAEYSSDKLESLIVDPEMGFLEEAGNEKQIEEEKKEMSENEGEGQAEVDGVEQRNTESPQDSKENEKSTTLINDKDLILNRISDSESALLNETDNVVIENNSEINKSGADVDAPKEMYSGETSETGIAYEKERKYDNSEENLEILDDDEDEDIASLVDSTDDEGNKDEWGDKIMKDDDEDDDDEPTCEDLCEDKPNKSDYKDIDTVNEFNLYIMLQNMAKRPNYLEALQPQSYCLNFRTRVQLQDRVTRHAMYKVYRKIPWLRFSLRRKPTGMHLALSPSFSGRIDMSMEQQWEIARRHMELFKLPSEFNINMFNLARPYTCDKCIGYALGNEPKEGNVLPSSFDNIVEGPLKELLDDDIPPECFINGLKSENVLPVQHGNKTNPAENENCSGQNQTENEKEANQFKHHASIVFSIMKPFASEANVNLVVNTILHELNKLLPVVEQNPGKCITFERGMEKKYYGNSERGFNSVDDLESHWKHLVQPLVDIINNAAPEVSNDNDKTEKVKVEVKNNNENVIDRDCSYIERTVELFTSKNFMNKCKNEKVNYISGFALCITAAISNILVKYGVKKRTDTFKISVTYNRHYNLPDLKDQQYEYVWHDSDYENSEFQEINPDRRKINRCCNTPMSSTFDTSFDDWCSQFWAKARHCSKNEWDWKKSYRSPTRFTCVLKIPKNPDYKKDPIFPPLYHPSATINITNITNDIVKFSQTLDCIESSTLEELSPFMIFFMTLNISLGIEKDHIKFTFHNLHSSCFSNRKAHEFADEIISLIEKAGKL